MSASVPPGFHAQADPEVCAIPGLGMAGQALVCGEAVVYQVRLGRWRRGYCAVHARMWLGDWLALSGRRRPLRVDVILSG